MKTITAKVTAISGKGVESLPAVATAIVQNDEILLRPAAVRSIRLRAIAGGNMETDLFYVQGPTPATEIQFSLAGPAGEADFTAPLLTVQLSGRTLKQTKNLGQTFTDGQTIRMAARAVCAGGYSDIVYSNPVRVAAVVPEIVLNYAEVAIYG